MKRFIFAISILFAVGAMAYAQGLPTSAQTRQEAQQVLTQSRSNSSQFESTLNTLVASDTSNRDAETFLRIRNEINRLEARINMEQTRIQNHLDANGQVNAQLFNQVQRLIDLHRARMDELEEFIAG
ncbi:MAG: hypothetical protein FWG66_05970 [Spirochaetes bacterium]|nr:hypothetical protein [Spirochaetota bacterium]